MALKLDPTMQISVLIGDRVCETSYLSSGYRRPDSIGSDFGTPTGLFEARADRRPQRKILAGRQKKSDEIDEQLKQRRASRLEESRSEVAGARTLEARRKAWRAVIQFHLIQNVVELLEKLPQLEISVLEKLDLLEEGKLISSCGQDLIAFFQDAYVRELLDATFETRPGLYLLPDVQRITAMEYVATDVDIIRAPLRPPGLSTHWVAASVSDDLQKRVYPYFDDAPQSFTLSVSELRFNSDATGRELFAMEVALFEW
ncbi:hypothetical protein C8J56DRAFT_895361 [Mycena floridula]|nr:hypothetical protein C8J56DRAFT_895361 [Mycena floridula]